MSIARYLSKLGALLGSDGKVPAAGLASGAAMANIGYTPVNKAGDTYGGYHTLSVRVEPNSSDMSSATRIGDSVFKTFMVNLPNGVANQGVRIYFPGSALWIDGEFWITGEYANGNKAGIAHYAFIRHTTNGSADYGTTINQQYTYGQAMTGYTIQGWGYDSANTRNYLEFRRTDTVGNPLWVTMRLIGTSAESVVAAYPVLITY